MNKPIPTLPDKWCILSENYSAKYTGNKIYLGKENNLKRATYVSVSWEFKDMPEQKEFFDWWKDKTSSGGLPFYAELPLFGESAISPAHGEFFLLVQSAPLIQTIYPFPKISGTFMLYGDKPKGATVAPTARDVRGVVEENSTGNSILLDIIDPDTPISSQQITLFGTYKGTAVVMGGSILYTPKTGFTGDVVIKYKVYDGIQNSNEAKIRIQVVKANLPIATSFTVNVSEDGVKRYFELKGKSRTGSPLTYTITNTGTTKNVIMQGATSDVAVLATDPHSTAPVSFKYKVNDGGNDSSEAQVDVVFVANIPVDPSKFFPTSLSLPTTFTHDIEMVLGKGDHYDPINKNVIDLEIVTPPTLPAGVSDLKVTSTSTVHTNKSQYILSAKTTGSSVGGNFDVDLKLGGVPFSMSIDVIDVSKNKRWMTMQDKRHIYGGSPTYPYTVFFAVSRDEPYGYPEPSDFPDVIWEVPTSPDGYCDIFTRYAITNQPLHAVISLLDYPTGSAGSSAGSAKVVVDSSIPDRGIITVGSDSGTKPIDILLFGY